MLHDVEEEARIKRILEVLDRTLRLALLIDEVVGRLSEKRVTLEEKMIRAYFHEVAANLHDVSSLLNRAMARATTPKAEGDSTGAPAPTEGKSTDAAAPVGDGSTKMASGSGTKSATGPKSTTGAKLNQTVRFATAEEIKHACQPFDQFLDRLEPSIEELLKALRYNLNFVEQYFEFNYYGKLTNEDRFLQDSADILKALASQLS